MSLRRFTPCCSLGRRLALVKMEAEGSCGAECQTLAMACDATIDGIENELGEALWSRKWPADTPARLCSAACRRPPPLLDAARPDGPPFRPYPTEREEQQKADQAEKRRAAEKRRQLEMQGIKPEL